MTEKELIMLQSLPLNIKVAKSKQRLREFINYMGLENVYLAFSGGKDSTVVSHLLLSMGYNIDHVFSNTGLEFFKVQKFVKEHCDRNNINLCEFRPKTSFKEVIEKFGYPMLSKRTARMISDLQNPTSRNKTSRELYLNSRTFIGKDGKEHFNGWYLADKHRYLIDSGIKITHKCCKYLKKDVLKDYEKSSGKRPIIGVLADEGGTRKSGYLKTGCNVFDEIKGACKPLGFWKEQDILQYILDNNIEIAEVYGDIVKSNGTLRLSGEQRTGCVYCGFGVHLEVGKNRYQRLELIDKKQYDYCINNLGFGKVLDTMKINYKND